ncbi:MAG: SUMF1/EgtB/PvdO family nonheme iron enzyme [Acidobacteriota bacterium]
MKFTGYLLKPGYLFARDPILGNLRYVPATGPAGFVQGSPSSEPCRWSDEQQFTHVLTRDLAVMETEVTRRAWEALKAKQPKLPADPTCPEFGSGKANPVQCVTWCEAVLFANLLAVSEDLTRCYYTDASKRIPIDGSNYLSGKYYCDFEACGYRLPTEAEWEWFCRAGTTGPFSVNESRYTSKDCGKPSLPGMFPELEAVAWFSANSSESRTSPVGTKKANPWNLKDVHGNALEWCWDWLATYPHPKRTNYAGPGRGTYRVERGGSFGFPAKACRSAFRDGDTPDYRGGSTGFRLVRKIDWALDDPACDDGEPSP